MWIALLLALLLVVVAVFFIIQSRHKNARKKQRNSTVAAQVNVSVQKRPLNPIERSWVFLHRITEAVRRKFSKKDQEYVLKLGEKLLQNGMHYKHVIDVRRPARARTVAKTVQPAKTSAKSK